MGAARSPPPYDMLFNRQRESRLRHGSCGLGFGATVARHEGPHKLHVVDLYDDFVLEQKLGSVADYYAAMGATFDADRLGVALQDFRLAVADCRSSLRCTSVPALMNDVKRAYDTVIFEGSQGILLDQEFGYFPHVTRAFTTSRNALELIGEMGLPQPTLHYVTRCYQTRHGNGPLTNEDREPPALRETPEETNVYNPWQGRQRRSLLDLDQLRYALTADAQYSAGRQRNLVITCLDQLNGAWRATERGSIIQLNEPAELSKKLGLPLLDVFLRSKLPVVKVQGGEVAHAGVGSSRNRSRYRVGGRCVGSGHSRLIAIGFLEYDRK